MVVLKIENFLFPRPRQLLVGAVRCWRFIRHTTISYAIVSNTEIYDFIVLLVKWQSLQTI